MATRGRRSVASLSVVSAFPNSRPSPPSDLGKAEAEEWRAVAARMPADWFPRETHALLKAYCGHVVSSAVLLSQIGIVQQTLSDETVGAYDRLLKMRDRESRAMTTLATKLRLTNQSRYDPAKANTAAKAAGLETKPWGAAVG